MKGIAMKDAWQMFVNSALLALILATAMLRAESQVVQDPPFGRPDAIVDLASREGVQLVSGQWRYRDVKIVDADSRAVGPDLKPSGAPTKTYDYEPRAVYHYQPCSVGEIIGRPCSL